MLTAGQLADSIVEETGRTDLRAGALASIQNVIREERRHLHWFQDRRLARITLVAGQAWYGRFDALSAERLADLDDTGATRLYEDGGEPADHSPWSLDGAEIAGGDVTDLLKFRDAQIIETGGDGQWWPLKRIGLRRFNEIRKPSDNNNQPEYICIDSGQIGFYPTPDRADIVRIYGNFLSLVPGEADTSAMIDHAEMFVRCAAKSYFYLHYLQDAKMSAAMDSRVTSLKNSLVKESRQRRGRAKLSARL